jgi:hypothetical protein
VRERDACAGEAGVVHVGEVAVEGLLVELAGRADREDPFDEPVAGVGLGAQAYFAPQDGTQSVRETCRLQGRPVLSYLPDAATATRHRQPVPSLVPT